MEIFDVEPDKELAVIKELTADFSGVELRQLLGVRRNLSNFALAVLLLKRFKLRSKSMEQSNKRSTNSLGDSSPAELGASKRPKSVPVTRAKAAMSSKDGTGSGVGTNEGGSAVVLEGKHTAALSAKADSRNTKSTAMVSKRFTNSPAELGASKRPKSVLTRAKAAMSSTDGTAWKLLVPEQDSVFGKMTKSDHFQSGPRTSHVGRQPMSRCKASFTSRLCSGCQVGRGHVTKTQRERTINTRQDMQRRKRKSVVRVGFIDPTQPGISFATPKGGNARGFAKEQHSAIL